MHNNLSLEYLYTREIYVTCRDVIFSFRYSFGYDCTQRSNLHVIDIETVIYIAGNMVVVLDMKSLNQRYIHSTSNGGIGNIAVRTL